MKYNNSGYDLASENEIKAIFIDQIRIYLITNTSLFIFHINEVTHSILKLAEHNLEVNQSITHNYYYQDKDNLIIDVSTDGIIIIKINDDNNVNITFINYKINVTLNDIDDDYDNHVLFIAAGDAGLLIIDYSNMTDINDIKLDNNDFQIENKQYDNINIDIRQVSYLTHKKTLMCFDTISQSISFFKYNNIKNIILLYHNELDNIQGDIISYIIFKNKKNDFGGNDSVDRASSSGLPTNDTNNFINNMKNFNQTSDYIDDINNALDSSNIAEQENYYITVITNDSANNKSNRLTSYIITIPDIYSERPKEVLFTFITNFDFEFYIYRDI